jgi:hypothetical protein
MTDEQICGQGHVIDAGRERCSRCNGLPVVNGEVVDKNENLFEGESPKAEEVESSVSSDESSVIPPSEEVAPIETPAAPAEDAPVVNDEVPPATEEGSSAEMG